MSDKKLISIEIESSKSLFNRALICEAFSTTKFIQGNSSAEDVQQLQNCLWQFHVRRDEPYYVGNGGTTLRFFALHASRLPGVYKIAGTQRLFSRPHDELSKLSEQLGFELKFGNDCLQIETGGWTQPRRPLRVSQAVSSQFMSAVVLNSWNLDFDLEVETHSGKASNSYLDMTFDLVHKFGMEYNRNDTVIKILRRQRPLIEKYIIEPDMSSAFFVSALASDQFDIEIPNFTRVSLQPDVKFVKVLQEMGYKLNFDNGIKVQRPTSTKAITLDLENTPDLFPVLAILCARANGTSQLTGLKNLVHKESNRLGRIKNFLSDLGVSSFTEEDSLTIQGNPDCFPHNNPIDFDTDQDHRLVMAAVVAQNLGAHVNINDYEPINKSFPQFFDLRTEISL